MKKILFPISIILAFLPTLSFSQGFSNVAENYNLDFSYSTSDYGGGVSFVDFNQDGLDDLTFSSEAGTPIHFFKNTGNGFETMNGLIDDTSGVKQLLWVDYNNDKLLDLYLTSESQNKLYRNNGNLEMEDVTLAAGFDFPLLTSYCSTWFDYDNDGKLDLLVAHRTEDKNGWIDLYRNLDYNSFEKNTIRAGLKSKGESVLAMTTFDYNNDGWQDIFLGQDWEKGNILLENNGNGTFKDVSRISKVDFKMNSMTATVMDINEDGWQDLYVSNTMMGNVLLVNDGAGSFEEKAAYYNLDLSSVTFGTVFFDADNDSDNDVHVGGLTANYTFEDINDEEEFKRRNNDWGFFLDGEFNNGVAVGDFNNDGFIDIVKNSVTRGDFYLSKNSLWENQFSNNKFIKIQLEGTISNHFAIGSKIMVYANDKVQHKRVGCGESFSSQHSLTQHFGMNQADMIDSIVVQWSSNNISVITNVPTNQTIVITEPLYGCTDMQACNYHPLAQSDNGSCRYAENFYDCFGCITDSDEDGVCDQLEISGCNEFDACNFSIDATENDGSCYYLPTHTIAGPTEWEALKEVQYTYPAVANSRYEWTIKNGSILAGNETAEVIVIWYENEEGELFVNEIDEANCMGSTISKTVQITSLEAQPADDFFISPNPVADLLTVHNTQSSYPYFIYNTIGQVIQEGNLDEFQNQISVSKLTSGLYFLEIKKESSTFKEKFYKE